MSTQNIRKFVAQGFLSPDWRQSQSVNIQGFTVQEVPVMISPKYSGRGLEIGIDMNDPMVKTLVASGQLEQFLSYIGHAFRVAHEKGYKEGVRSVRNEMGQVMNLCDSILDERTEEQRDVDEYLERNPSTSINPLLDNDMCRELFEGSYIVRNTPRG